MPEANQFTFSYRELAEMMVKQAGIRDGLWGLYVKFGLAATNVGETEEDLRPAAIVSLIEIGLQRFEKPSNLAVDAALVNAASSRRAASRTK